MNLLSRYATWMVTKGGAPSRYAAYRQLLLLVGVVTLLGVLLWILWEATHAR